MKLFTWIEIYRKETAIRGFGYHDGTRKYLDGLKSSDINHAAKGLVLSRRMVDPILDTCLSFSANQRISCLYRLLDLDAGDGG